MHLQFILCIFVSFEIKIYISARQRTKRAGKNLQIRNIFCATVRMSADCSLVSGCRKSNEVGRRTKCDKTLQKHQDFTF